MGQTRQFYQKKDCKRYYLQESLGIAEVRGNIVGKAEPLGLVQGLVVENTSLSKMSYQKWPKLAQMHTLLLPNV